MLLSNGVSCSRHSLASTMLPFFPTPVSFRQPRVSLHSRGVCTRAATDEEPSNGLDDSAWKLRALPSILKAFAKTQLPQEVVQSIIEDHYLRYEIELMRKDYLLKMAIQDYLRAQRRFDARGLIEYAQRVLAISKDANTLQDPHKKWSAVFKDKPQLLGCIQEKLGMSLGPSKAASMVLNAHSLTSGVIHSGKFVQPDTDAIVIYEGVLPRDLMLLTECLALEVNAPYKMVYVSEGTKGEV